MSTLLIAAGITALTSVVYGYVGYKMNQRRVSPHAKAAQKAFVFWWVALAAISLLGALLQVLYVADMLSMGLYQAFTQVTLLVVVAALAALLFYLIFVYTGSPRAWILPAVYAILAFLLIEAFIFLTPAPDVLTDDGWRLTTEPEPDIPPAVGAALSLFLLGPQIGAAIAYALLWRKANDPTSRYRIALVSTSIIVWFGASFVAGLANANETRAWQVGSTLLSLAAAAAILLAYLPPKAWQDRHGLRHIDGETA